MTTGTRTNTRDGSRNLFDSSIQPPRMPRTSERKFRNRPNGLINTMNQNSYLSNTIDPLSGSMIPRTADRLGPTTAGSSGAMENDMVREDITD